MKYVFAQLISSTNTTVTAKCNCGVIMEMKKEFFNKSKLIICQSCYNENKHIIYKLQRIYGDAFCTKTMTCNGARFVGLSDNKLQIHCRECNSLFERPISKLDTPQYYLEHITPSIFTRCDKCDPKKARQHRLIPQNIKPKPKKVTAQNYQPLPTTGPRKLMGKTGYKKWLEKWFGDESISISSYTSAKNRNDIDHLRIKVDTRKLIFNRYIASNLNVAYSYMNSTVKLTCKTCNESETVKLSRIFRSDMIQCKTCIMKERIRLQNERDVDKAANQAVKVLRKLKQSQIQHKPIFKSKHSKVWNNKVAPIVEIIKYQQEYKGVIFKWLRYNTSLSKIYVWYECSICGTRNKVLLSKIHKRNCLCKCYRTKKHNTNQKIYPLEPVDVNPQVIDTEVPERNKMWMKQSPHAKVTNGVYNFTLNCNCGDIESVKEYRARYDKLLACSKCDTVESQHRSALNIASSYIGKQFQQLKVKQFSGEWVLEKRRIRPILKCECIYCKNITYQTSYEVKTNRCNNCLGELNTFEKSVEIGRTYNNMEVIGFVDDNRDLVRCKCINCNGKQVVFRTYLTTESYVPCKGCGITYGRNRSVKIVDYISFANDDYFEPYPSNDLTFIINH